MRAVDAGPAADWEQSRARWAAVHAAVTAALDLPEADRDAFIDRECGDDVPLRDEVRRLVRSCERAERAADFLTGSATAYAGPLIADAAARADALRDAIPAALAAAVRDRYVVSREIGRGGMATVFLARDPRHHREVAIKVVHPDLAPALATQRFLREIEIAARLQHPNILPLYDSGAGAGLLYYVMPYIPGESLRAALAREGTLPIRDAVRLLREIADALATAHDQGIVHRDIKPENILLSRGHALVADFGVARALAAAAGSPDDSDVNRWLTSVGLVLGTPAYMAPEQAAGMPADRRTDLYAFGLVAYELLTGAHPFADRASDAQRGARTTGVPEPVRHRRPTVPAGLAALVMQLLERDPDDRPQSAEAVVEALDLLAITRARSPLGPLRWLRWPRAAALATVGMVTGLAATGLVIARAHRLADSLDPNRVVVFPLGTAGSGLPAGSGEDVATLLGYALEGSAPLRWLEGSDYVNARQRVDIGLVSAEQRRAISRAQRAGFYIDGSVIQQGDSCRVILRLHSVAGDSLVTRGSAAALAREVPATQLGVRAVGTLLVALLEPGRRVDASALAERAPAAISDFLRGEREYRASHFGRALELYHAALGKDTLLTLAALKGAQAASWLDRQEDAARLARLAVARASTLAPHRASFARGLAHYLAGSADSAVGSFQQALAFDAEASEPWMALGEVYRHLLPNAVSIDSLAEASFARARRVDTTLSPPLYHMAELALARGAIARADTLINAYRRVSPDSVVDRPLDLALRCVRQGPGSVAWARVAQAAPTNVLEASVVLAARATHAACAERALRALLATDAAGETERWAALFALQSLLVATGRDGELGALFRSPAAVALDAQSLLLLDASAGAAVGHEAEAVAREIGTDYGTLSAYKLWLLGTWEASRGAADRVRLIQRALAKKADASGERGDALLARAIAARSTLLDGDTALAIQQLRALTPTAPRPELLWYPGEGLGGERLLLATLLAARHDYIGAERAAAQLDASHPVVYLIHLRASLLLRARVADAVGDPARASAHRTRLSKLSQSGPRLTPNERSTQSREER